MSINNLLPWSHTKIETFEQCPKKFYHVYILKEKESPEPVHLIEGKRVHKAFEDRVVGNRPLPPELMKHEPMVYALKLKQEAGYALHAEVKYGLDKFYKPTGFFDKNVWGRGAADVVLVSPDLRAGIVLDYKTGKRKEGDTQLGRLALFMFCTEPTLERVTAANIWLNENKLGKTYEFTHASVVTIKGDIQRTLDAAETAGERGEWPEKPTPLCGWCHITSCRFNTKRK